MWLFFVKAIFENLAVVQIPYTNAYKKFELPISRYFSARGRIRTLVFLYILTTLIFKFLK